MHKEIRSDLPGVFYRSPAPGEKPHANVGDLLAEDSLIGVIELMKQFNEVRSGVAGILCEFLVADGDSVDAEMALAIVTEQVNKP